MQLVELGKIIASGVKFVGAEVYIARLAKCRECEFGKLQLSRITCEKCGCDMRIKAKLSACSCPLGGNW